MTSIRAATLASVAAAAAVLAVLLVVGHARSDHGPPTTRETRDAAVADTLRGLDASDFVRLRVADPPSRRTTSAPSWVYGELRPTVDGYESTWEADLAVGAIAVRLHTRPTQTASSVIAGATFTFSTTSGSGSGPGRLRASVEVGPAPVEQTFSLPTDAPEASVESDIDATLRSIGLTPTSVRVLRPYGPAVYVDLTVDPSAAPARPIDLTSVEIALAGSFGDHTMEGVMVEAHDPAGRLLAVAYTASRVSTGGAWTDPRYRALFPSAHG